MAESASPDGGPEGLEPAQLASILLRVADDLAAALGRDGEGASVLRLHGARSDLRARLAGGQQGRLELEFAQDRVAGVIDGALRAHRDKGPPELQAGLDLVERRMVTWRVLRERLHDPVSYEQLAAEVLRDPGVQQDARSVGIEDDALREELLARREAVLGEAGNLLAGVRAAASALGAELVAQRSATLEDPEKPGALWHRPATADAAALAPLEAEEALRTQLLEASAAADAAVKSYIELQARSALSQHATNLRGTHLELASTAGLAQVIDGQLEIRTETAERLRRLLERMKGGSVGLAGPRGVGKSTLMRRFVDGRESFGERPVLAVDVSAPVAYDSRDFMLHLFAETCLAAGAVEAPADGNDDRPPRWAGAATRALMFALPLLAAALILFGVAALVAQLLHGDHDLVVWGAACLLGAGLLGAMLFAVARDDGPRAGLIALAPAGIAVAFGMALVVLGIKGETIDAAIVRAVGTALLGTALLSAAFVVAARARDAEARRHADRHRAEWLPDDDLRRAASLRLENLRYQQSYKVGITGKVALPAGLEVGGSSERSMARHPMTFPEVVGAFRKFLAFAAEHRDVLIAIDELDKLRDDDGAADRFLNDLKAMFGLRDTYFLVSVSEDAMSRFERRGLPFRDVFDSTFDEIVPMEPMRLAESRELLARRVVGLPYIYSGLCHALSGGVPRDLVRTARRIVEIDATVEPRGDLAAITERLVAAELQAKARAVESAACTQSPPATLMDPFLEWLATFRTDGLPQSPAAFADRPTNLPMIGLAAAAGGDEQGHARELLRLASELATYQYFMCTVREFFSQPLDGARVMAAAGPETAAPTLEQLAAARMAFGASAQSAWRAISAFRAPAGLVGPSVVG